MTNPDNNPLRECFTCGRAELDSLCLELNDHFFCCIQCKTEQQKKEDDALIQSRIRDLYS
jgi:hypothetical protein